MTTTATLPRRVTWAEAAVLCREQPLGPLAALDESTIVRALDLHLEGDAPTGYDAERLHYGADLDPEACPRKTWYRLKGTERHETLGDRIRFWGGRTLESLVVAALQAEELVLDTQALAQPLRPSAWAFAPGHADVLLIGGLLLEIKAPRAGSFAKAGSDRRRLVREGHRWQLSAYFHELKRQGKCDRAAWLFLDREGSNAPVLVPLEGELLVPLERIVQEEQRRSALVNLAEAPPRLERNVVVEVLKGRAKKEVQRVVRAHSDRSWQCGYCPYSRTCQPGPESVEVELEDDEHERCVAEAEERWKLQPRAKVVIHLTGPEPEDDEQAVEATAEEDVL